MESVTIIGIAGGSGSGKTTLARNIANHFGDKIAILRHDDYYKEHSDLPYEERNKLNYDHPDAFDTPLLIKHLDALRQGHPIDCPTYDYTQSFNDSRVGKDKYSFDKNYRARLYSSCFIRAVVLGVIVGWAVYWMTLAKRVQMLY